MQDLVLIVLFLIVAGSVSLIKWYVEKAQREARERGVPLSRPPAPGEPYARPDDRGQAAATSRPARRSVGEAGSPLETARRPAMPGHARPGQPRPAPMLPGLHPAPARGPVPRPVPVRPARPQPPPPVEAILVEEEQPIGPVASLAGHRLETLQAAKVSSLVGHRLEGTHLEARAGRAPARPRDRAGYLADLVHPPNLARAVVLAEVFGPPKGLE